MSSFGQEKWTLCFLENDYLETCVQPMSPRIIIIVIEEVCGVR